ncbi:Plastocyanin-like [Macleaya cordata]|uniref:Plastocyanin-like n=1 Tax=Macleaya cordata TaxID=56857 RepID=A0A200RC16_MACCD|nr:Plastocyanin-like [Macleaya cordata]
MKNKSMASLLGFFCIFLIITTITTVTAMKADRVAARGASHEFKVGDEGGWREPDANNTEMYNQWATKNKFKVGDSLYFEYRNDSVLEVDKQGYYHCNMTKPIASFNDCKTVIKLVKPGPFYFISGAPDHCKNGQRLLINVINPYPSPPPSPSIRPSPPSHPSIADS